MDAIDVRDGEEAQRASLQRLQRLLPRTVVAELLLGLAVLASASVLSQTTTAGGELRQAASQPSGEFIESAEVDDLSVLLRIEPFGLGVNTFTVGLEALPGAELGEVLAVELRAFFDDPNAPPSAGATGTRQELEPTDEVGVWAAEAALMTQPGDWRLETRIRRRGFDDSEARFSVPEVGGILARTDEPEDLFELPFTFVDWNIVAGGAMAALGLGAVLMWLNRPPWWRRALGTSVGLSGAFGLMAGAVLIFGVDAHDTGFQRNSPYEATEASLAIGRGLFTNNCQSCHGVGGLGDGPGAGRVRPADLNLHVPLHNDGTAFIWITEGIPIDKEVKPMPSFKDVLTDEERWHLVNYLREAFDTGSIEPGPPEATIE